VIKQLKQEGNALASETVRLPVGTRGHTQLLSENVEANPAAVGGPIIVTVTPTPAPKVPDNLSSILSAGNAIIDKFDSL